MNPFHLAIAVTDLATTRKFYIDILGAKVGREADKWIDFDFFGHQVSAHVKPEECQPAKENEVDGRQVPVRHFGVILDWRDWHLLARQLNANNMTFIIEPYIRFAGKAGEQATMFFYDPSGNALEFKSFKDQSQLFTR